MSAASARPGLAIASTMSDRHRDIAERAGEIAERVHEAFAERLGGVDGGGVSQRREVVPPQPDRCGASDSRPTATVIHGAGERK